MVLKGNKNIMSENDEIVKDLVKISKFAIDNSQEDVRLFLARLVRKYRNTNQELSEALGTLLRNKPDSSILRNREVTYSTESWVSDSYEGNPNFINGPLDCAKMIDPILAPELSEKLTRIIDEHHNAEKLKRAGLQPSSTMVFTGRPGVGKTLTAHWLARNLALPLYTVNLATIVSSYLGKTGNNLKVALDYARSKPMVLLLDEIDAFAKTRNDETDVGEIKRIVTVLLQEIEQWPSTSVLIAATNYPEIVDRALWRRFDHVLQFDLPSKSLIKKALKSFFVNDYSSFETYSSVLETLFEGRSFSDIERSILEYRRAIAIGNSTPEEIINQEISSITDKKRRFTVAMELLNHTDWSQYKINKLTGVSRDTLRKYKTI